MSDLIRLVTGAPAAALALAALSALIYLVEKVAGLTGPMSRLATWWRGRELARLRREAAYRAERRRLQHAEETAVMADLRTQISELSLEVARLRGVVRSAEANHRAIREWADGLLRAARAAGLQYVDPPTTDESPAVPAPR